MRGGDVGNIEEVYEVMMDMNGYATIAGDTVDEFRVERV